MYGTNGSTLALPATGTGAMALAAGTHQAWLLAFSVAVLAVWTIVMAVCALLRILPKREV